VRELPVGEASVDEIPVKNLPIEIVKGNIFDL
jgi:hypothetical protein